MLVSTIERNPDVYRRGENMLSGTPGIEARIKKPAATIATKAAVACRSCRQVETPSRLAPAFRRAKPRTFCAAQWESFSGG
jgi:hypothetical protein